jgi:hypothetical protein
MRLYGKAFRVTSARQAVLVSAVLLASACGGDSGPAKIEAEGAWSGTLDVATLTMTLVETNGTVTGSGSLSTATDAVAITATGTYTSPSLALTLSAPGFSNIAVQATVGQSSMTGTANGSGFVNASVSLQRQ